jgi:hypothetical protein
MIFAAGFSDKISAIDNSGSISIFEKNSPGALIRVIILRRGGAVPFFVKIWNRYPKSHRTEKTRKNLMVWGVVKKQKKL